MSKTKIMYSFYALLLGMVFFVSGCARDEVSGIDSYEIELRSLVSDEYLLPSSFAAIPFDPKNPLTQNKISLGELLFFETALGNEGINNGFEQSYSCASCHHAGAGFQAGIAQGIAEGGEGFLNRRKHSAVLDTMADVQPVKSPSIVNSAFLSHALWNGKLGNGGDNSDLAIRSQLLSIPENQFGFQAVETQAIAGLNVHRMVKDKLPESFLNLGYRELFDKAFADVEESERYSRVTTGLAIAAYERTVLANLSPFQKWIRGDNNAMSSEEKKGAILFFTKGECSQCHNGPSFSDQKFHALGMNNLYDTRGNFVNVSSNHVDHLGRGGFTKDKSEEYAFKTPQLYNLKDVNFYGHGSTFESIVDVISYKNEAVVENADAKNISPSFQPLLLTDDEVYSIALFLERSLFDPELSRYVPDRVLSDHCIPNNDQLSKIEICNGEGFPSLFL